MTFSAPLRWPQCILFDSFDYSIQGADHFVHMPSLRLEDAHSTTICRRHIDIALGISAFTFISIASRASTAPARHSLSTAPDAEMPTLPAAEADGLHAAEASSRFDVMHHLCRIESSAKAAASPTAASTRCFHD